MQINMTGRGIELTPAIEAYVEKKFGGLDKFFDGIIRAVVTVGMETKHHKNGDVFYAECKLEVPGNDVFDKKMANDLYAAIDTLHDYLATELKKHKAKLRGNDKEKNLSARNNKGYTGE